MDVKKVLLFSHYDTCNGIFNAMDGFIASELKNRGIKYEYIDVTQSRDSLVYNMNNILDESFDAVLTFNDPDCHSILTEDGESIYDKYNIQFFNWIMDHPVSQLHYLDSPCKNYNIICVDKEHVNFLNRYRPQINGTFFLPLGGLAISTDTPMPIAEREYDIVFPGGFGSCTLKDALDSYKRMESPNKEIILNLIDYMMNNSDIDVTVALDIILRDLGISDIDDDDYRKALMLAAAATSFMRDYYRELVLRSLIRSDLDFHIFGNGWEKRIGKGVNTTFHSGCSFNETEKVFRNAKIVLNIMPCFKNGTHDRIASAMLNKAVVITDHSKFLDEIPDGLMSFYDINNIDEIVGITKDLLGNPEKMQDIADKGYDYACSHFAWSKTVDALLEIIKESRKY